MPAREAPILFSLVLLAGCSGEAEPAGESPTRSAESSEIVLQAVDAGTGAALTDGQFTVRYLVRAPITLDASAVEQVSASEPYRIVHAVSEDNLVVELRLEAASYHRIDTVMTVARGASAGPYTVRMTRRLDRASSARPSRAGLTNPPPAATPSQPTDPDAGIDRAALRAGNEAFQARNWAAATRAYLNMVEPPRRTSPYAQAYQQALVRQGVSHINLGEWAGAVNALEEAVSFESPGFNAYLTLAQAQCEVGRTDEGRASLDQIEGMASSIPGQERPVVLALAACQGAVCGQGGFQRAESAIQRVQTGSLTIQAFEAFIEQAEALNPIPARLQQTIGNARRRIAEIRDRMRRGD